MEMEDGWINAAPTPTGKHFWGMFLQMTGFRELALKVDLVKKVADSKENLLNPDLLDKKSNPKGIKSSPKQMAK